MLLLRALSFFVNTQMPIYLDIDMGGVFTTGVPPDPKRMVVS
jgi:hypothetical protein